MHWFILGGYLLACILFLGGATLLRVRGRRDRQPFAAGQRLLRGPGESLRRRLQLHRQSELADILAAFVLPVLASVVFFQIVTRLEETGQLLALLAAAFALAAALAFLLRRLLGRINHARNLYLGHFGERVVAESLEPLKAGGHLVFHDMPAGETGDDFNLDHVIVGPRGVFAIETKTRRQSPRSAGFMLHEIIHDGQVLAFPWGEDRHGLDQALRQARWLQELIARETGISTPVRPLLTFPGWTIVRRGDGPVRVLAPADIPAAVDADDTASLTPGQASRIATLLDARCRDVEY
ncbi:MAG: nuclease-related domain-containing protein [Verrucomicrobiota bacterium]